MSLLVRESELFGGIKMDSHLGECDASYYTYLEKIWEANSERSRVQAFILNSIINSNRFKWICMNNSSSGSATHI